MWNKIFDLYCDIMTLDWLARRLGSMGRALGCYLFVAGLLWFYFGVLPEQPGHYYATMARTGSQGMHEATTTAHYVYGMLSIGMAAIGFLLSLPHSNASGKPRRFYRNPFIFSRLTKQYRNTKDPWISLPCRIGHHAFGDASLHPFSWYLKRQSIVHAPNIDRICNFLLKCRYMSDREQFGLADFWQHPTVLEKRKRGDCDDFALWAWRKLCESGIDAEFVVGRWRTPASTTTATTYNHAWVIFRANEQAYLLETTCRAEKQMVRRLAEARHEYIPYFSVNRASRTRVYGGYVGRSAEIKPSNAMRPFSS